jgi:hypothetical protein
MLRKSMDGAAWTEACVPAERVTLRIPTHMAAPSHALILGPPEDACALRRL